MTFLTVLITFVYRHLMSEAGAPHRFGWFEAYCRRLWTLGLSGRRAVHAWGAILVLAPVLLVTVWLQWLAADLGWLVTLGFGVFVLLMSLGPGDLPADTEAFIAARDVGDDAQATAVAETLCLGDAPREEPQRSFAVARAVVILANRRLVGPVFWFVVVGPVGAIVYRLIQVLDERVGTGDCPAALHHSSGRLRRAADWLPGRVTAAGYAIAGSFDAVAQAWRNVDQAVDDELTGTEALLASAGLAALETFPEDAEALVGDADVSAYSGLMPPVVEDALALVRRSLMVWFVLIGAGSLVAVMS